MIAPEPYLSAYLEVTRRVILHTRSMAWENSRSLTRRVSRKRAEQMADLQDAVHIVVELLNDWERCDEPALRRNFLEAYDEKWVKTESDFSLLRIFNTVLLGSSNK